MAPLPLPSSQSETPLPQPNFPFSFLLSSPSRPLIPDRAAQNAHQFLKHLSDTFSNHPLVKPIFSIHAEYRSFCQMHLKRGLIKPTNFSSLGFGAVLPGDSVAGLVVANGVSNFLNIYNGILITRIVLTWFPNAPQFIVNPLRTLCDPYLNIFRGLIPPLGGIDLSPILAFLVLDAFTSTAAALPAEIPKQGTSLNNLNNLNKFENVKKSEELWSRRMFFAKKNKKSDEIED